MSGGKTSIDCHCGCDCPSSSSLSLLVWLYPIPWGLFQPRFPTASQLSSQFPVSVFFLSFRLKICGKYVTFFVLCKNDRVAFDNYWVFSDFLAWHTSFLFFSPASLLEKTTVSNSLLHSLLLICTNLFLCLPSLIKKVESACLHIFAKNCIFVTESLLAGLPLINPLCASCSIFVTLHC